ncbi:hypothetical protein AMELA_G00258570 [Ameiurus melas]|uniref:Dynein regulatory complex protein 10 n=1 Tax=Ameiurus melas TaxID=219545 RepID=A0A7J5ZSI1_AMEME|nr:hypothetical protein AMELA_G00258570 [Ameiurus melas]
MAATGRKKLMSLEAQRIINVLDECAHKIDVVSLLPRELVRPERVFQELGGTAVESLREHLRLSDQYRSLQDTDTGNDELLVRAVQDSLRNFQRHVRPHEEAQPAKAALREAGPIIEEDQKAVQELGAGLQGFRDMLMERLMTTPQEEQERRRHGQEVKERQQRNVELLRTLEQEMRAATEHRDTVIATKDGEIRHMQDSLHQMERAWEEFVQQVQKKAEQQHQSDLKNSELKRPQLQEEANQLRAQLDRLITQHREREAMMRKKNNKLETEIENWIQKYDVEMEEKQAKLERLTQTYAEEQAELCELQERFAVLELEYTQIVEERRRERERKEEEERERQVKSRAAVVIQALWRGWRVRQALKKKAKSGKGKKPPRKGKKGK